MFVTQSHNKRNSNSNSNSKSNNIEGIAKSSKMERFERLVLRAAKNKRKDIIDRYGPDGCAKVLAKGKEAKREQDIKKNYESTIRNLLESWETSPRDDKTTTTKNIDKIINSAWKWNIHASDVAKKQKERRGIHQQQQQRSRRHSMEV